MSKRFTNIEIDNRGDTIILNDNGVFTVYNLQELEDLLNKQDQRINELEEENTHLCNFNSHNIFNKKNKEINQLKKELQSWKDTAEALQDQLAHHMEVVTDDYKAMQNL